MTFSKKLAFVVVTTILACSSPPSDQALRDEFRENRRDYERLLQMFLEDKSLGRVAYDFTRSASFFSGKPITTSTTIPQARLDEYRRLFDRLSLSGGIEGYDEKEDVYFWRYSSGMGAGLGGSGKGFAFSRRLSSDKPSKVGCGKPREDCWQFRPIDSGWFILDEAHN
jgi:hypothetical protein